MHKQAPAASFTCITCKDTHQTYDSLVDHSAIHANISQVCPLCKASIPDFDSVERHMQAHKESERHACEFCDYIFLSSDQLQKHIEDDHVVDMVPYQNDSDYTGDKSLPEEGDLLEELLGDEESQSQSNDSTSPPKAKIRKLSPAKKPERKSIKQEVIVENIKKESSPRSPEESAAVLSVSSEDRRKTRSRESNESSLKSDSRKKLAKKPVETKEPKQENRQRNGRITKK